MPSSTRSKIMLGPRHGVRSPGSRVETAFRLITDGEFWMGSLGDGNADEEPRHRVVIAEPFWMGEMPITQKQLPSERGPRVSSTKIASRANRCIP